MNKVISMPGGTNPPASRPRGVRDRRYALRYPFAADAELIDLETGAQVQGVTSDISFGGCFVCASKPLPVNSRIRLTLSRKGQSFEALAIVRIVHPRVGLGLEFFNLEPPNDQIMSRWIEALRRPR